MQVESRGTLRMVCNIARHPLDLLSPAQGRAQRRSSTQLAAVLSSRYSKAQAMHTEAVLLHMLKSACFLADLHTCMAEHPLLRTCTDPQASAARHSKVQCIIIMISAPAQLLSSQQIWSTLRC